MHRGSDWVQPEGLSDSSRWSQRSVDHRETSEKNSATRRVARKIVALMGADERSFRSGGLRYAPNTGSDSLSG